MRNWTIAITSAVLLAGCGSDNPAGPGPQPPNVSIVAPEGVLFLGETYTFSMNARTRDGAVVTTGGTWGSDAPGVATVEAATGRVQIVGIGEATIFVDFEGVRALRRIRSTVNYAGTVSGAFRVTACAQTGVFAQENVCRETSRGSTFGFLGTFTQNGETVTATMDLIEFSADPVSATIDGAGELRFESEHREDLLTATAQWVLRPAGLRQIRGTVVIRTRVIGASGTWTLNADVLPTTILRSGNLVAAPSHQRLRGVLRVPRS